MGTMASPITSLTRLFTQPFIQTQIKENIKVAFVWGIHRGGGVEFPAQMASNAENVSIWCRHHDIIGQDERALSGSRVRVTSPNLGIHLIDMA